VLATLAAAIQINDSKVPATSAMYQVSGWRKFDWSCTNRR